MAGAASFRHVHDWTMHNSPTGTADWFGWANAVITELIPTASLIIIAKRRRHGGPIGYPMFLLVVAVGLSLTAQLAVAQSTVFGWMVSALPAVAFFALSKLVFSATKHAHTATDTAPAAVPAPVDVATVGRADRPHRSPGNPACPQGLGPQAGHACPCNVNRHRHRQGSPGSRHNDQGPTHTQEAHQPARSAPPPNPHPTRRRSPPPRRAPPAAVDEPTVAQTPASVSTDLLPTARLYADSHHRTHGEPITPGQLAVRMRIPTTEADRLLHAINTTPDYADPPALTGPHNGSRPRQDVTA